MIPILYEKGTTDFSNNGLGFLKDATKATVTEERNGSYELSLQYPITGQWYELLGDGCIVKAKANETSKPQLFRIYKTSKPLKGIVTYSAEHISYDLNGLPIAGFSITNATPQMAITRALEQTPLSHSFTAVSDISTLNRTSILTPCSVRALLGGQSGSVLDVWGGEYEFDNFVINLHAHRGKNNGVSIEYGKNLQDLKQESNIAECYTHIMPYAVYNKDDGAGNSEEEYVYLSERILPLVKAENIGHSKAFIMDFSDSFGNGETPTEESLREKANAYIATADLGTPKINITVSFVQLWQTEEYKNIAPLERVSLCDTVAVKFSKLGVTASAKVIKTVYDALAERYDSIELGDAKSSFADTISKQDSEISEIKTAAKAGQAKAAAAWKDAIKKATNLITGHSGGYVVLNPAEMPQEILILDAPTIEEAVNVWRWNSGGLGFSSTGYNGDFTTAITMDGTIVADFIAAGVLNGALLQADSVQASALSVDYKTSVLTEIADATKEISQAFKVADEQVLSSIKETLKDYSTTKETESYVKQTANSILSSVSATLKSYSTTEETKSLIQQTADSITSSVTKTLKSYSTTTQMQSAITQTSDSIMLEVNKKVNDSDFGTKIAQNYSSVRIAWNSISKYIEFASGAINIYESTAQGTENLLMKMNSTGAWYYKNGTTIGKIGTNKWQGDDSFKGLVFDLEYGADYMCWACEETASATAYSAQLIYYANNRKLTKGLHLNCATYCNGNLYINDYVRTVNYSDGGGGLYSKNRYVSLTGKGCSFTCDDDFTFGNSANKLVDCYNNIDLHNYSILNQSDARYKENITPTQVDALSVLSAIELKAFDWIESGEHSEIGFIAQQLQEVLPDLVNENGQTGRLSVKTDKLIPYLVKAVQELSSLVANSGTLPNYTLVNETTTKNNAYAMPKQWIDKYTDEEKRNFIANNKPKAFDKEIIESEPILIPITKPKIEEVGENE